MVRLHWPAPPSSTAGLMSTRWCRAVPFSVLWCLLGSQAQNLRDALGAAKRVRARSARCECSCDDGHDANQPVARGAWHGRPVLGLLQAAKTGEDARGGAPVQLSCAELFGQDEDRCRVVQRHAELEECCAGSGGYQTQAGHAGRRREAVGERVPRDTWSMRDARAHERAARPARTSARRRAVQCTPRYGCG